MTVIAAVFLIAAMTAILPLMPVHAADITKTSPGEGFVKTEKGTRWKMADGSYLKSDWLHYKGGTWYLNSKGYVCKGLVTVGGKVYYLTKDGKLKKGWIQIDNTVYFFNTDGVRNFTMAVKGKKINSNGTFTEKYAAGLQKKLPKGSDATRQEVRDLAVGIIACTTTDKMSKGQKLYAVYKWLVGYPKYKRTYDTPKGDWTASYALQLLTTRKGNCYRFAATFAYLAKALGYNSRIITGQVSAARGGVTPHGWDEIRSDGKWYVYDPELQFSLHLNLYKLTYSSYPITPLIKQHTWKVKY